MPSTLDLLTINSADRAMKIPVDFTDIYPELSFFNATPVPEINFNAAIAVPSKGQGGFREPNKGIVRAAPDILLRPVQCKLFDGSWDADIGAARGYHRGPDEYYSLMRETAMLATLSKICRQIWWGKGENADGFEGLAQHVIDDTPQSGIKTDGCEQVFMVRTGEPFTQLAWGKGATIEVEGPFTTTHTETVAGETKKHNRIGETVTAWCGLQVGSAFSFGVHYHPTWEDGAEAPHDILTDNHLLSLLARFHVGFRPTAIFMSRKSAASLRASRTAVNITGAPAPTPDEIAGIPIYITESLTVDGPRSITP